MVDVLRFERRRTPAASHRRFWIFVRLPSRPNAVIDSGDTRRGSRHRMASETPFMNNFRARNHAPLRTAAGRRALGILEGWGGRRDSNPQQQAPQAWTLPLSYDHQPRIH